MTAAKRRSSTGTANSAAVQQQQYQLHPRQQQPQQQHQEQQQQQQQHHHQQQQQLYQHVQTYQYTGQHSNRNNQQNHQHHHHHHQHSSRQQHHSQQHYQKLRDCSVKLPLDILWLPKSAMRPAGPEASHTDCILVVGVSRPKLAVVFLTVMLISLFLTFHVLYDSAVYNIQAAQQSVTTRQRLALLSAAAAAGNRLPEFIKPAGVGGGFGGGIAGGVSNTGSLSVVTSSNQISHPMVFPSNRVHFPKTSRRLPQALIIGIRKCGTRALLEMLYLHPRIQKAGGEVHFFDRDENYMKGLEWYRKKMPHSFRGQITIEKSPSYFVSPEVPERVRAMNASVKLLLIVREPVTRAISDYTQLRSHAATATLPLAAADNVPAELGVAALLKTPTSVRLTMAEKTLTLPLPQQKSQSLLHGKLSAYSAAAAAAAASHVASYEGDEGRGGYGSNRNGAPGASARNGNINRVYDVGGFAAGSGNGGAEYFSMAAATAPSQLSSLSMNGGAAAAAAAAAQIASRSFEELAMFPNGTVNESYRPLTISMYHLHLHRWLEVFPREQLLVVNGDRLIDDPVSQLRRIESFLGIEHRVTSKHFYFNETKGFYCLRYDSGDRCLRETKGRRHPHVDPIVISKLRKFFAEHNQRFYELVGEDLGWPEE